MFTKKALQITLACVLLVGLAAVGLVYGTWTQQLNVNGTAGTGTFDVKMGLLWYDDSAVPGTSCSAVISPDGYTMTVTIVNAFPGYFCEGGASIINQSSISAKINGLAPVTNTVPATFFFTPPGLVYMNDAIGNTIPTGGSFTLAAHTTGGGVSWSFAVPSTESGHEGENYSFSYTFLAEQAVP